MHPILFEIGPFSLRTYGLLVAVAFVVAVHLARAGARLERVDQAFMIDLVALLVASGLLGARLLYVILNFHYFAQHPWQSFAFWRGGLVFYGGFLGAIPAGVWYVLRHGVPLGRVADALAPGLAIGQAVGRWGCFFAGCCYGKPTNKPWAVTFKDPASLAPLGVPLHPTQIYESFGNLLIAAFLWIQLKKQRHESGQIFWFYVLLYGALRFAMEIVRGDDRGPTLGGLYPSQIISLSAMLLATCVLAAQASAREKRTWPRS